MNPIPYQIYNFKEKENAKSLYAKNNIEVNKSPNALNQSNDFQIPSLYKITERNLREETERKKMEALLSKLLKKLEKLGEEKLILKNELYEKNRKIEELEEEVKAKDKKLVTCQFIIKTYNELNFIKKKFFYCTRKSKWS